MGMIYLTADQLIATILNIKYPLYWGVRKAWYLIAITWLIAIPESVCIGLAYRYFGFTNEMKLNMHINITLDFCFCVLSVVTYSYIFHRYIKSRQNMSRANTKQQQTSTWSSFLHSRFFVTIIIVMSFFLLIALPDLFIILKLFFKRMVDKNTRYIIHILYSVNDLLHCFVYVFLKNNIRRRLRAAFSFASKCLPARRVSKSKKTEFTLGNN